MARKMSKAELRKFRLKNLRKARRVRMSNLHKPKMIMVYRQ